MEEETRELLTALANFLEHEVYAKMPERFDFSVVRRERVGDLSRGGAACAVGWMPQVPEFKKFGLVYRYPQQVTDRTGEHWQDCTRRILKLTAAQVSYLFTPSHYGVRTNASALQVANHIRNFVDVGGDLNLCP